jgi:hypothetical protein
VLQAFPNAGNHVLASPVKSNDVEGVTRAVADFLSNVLQLPPAGNAQN